MIALDEWIVANYIIRPLTPEKTLTEAYFIISGGFRVRDAEGKEWILDLRGASSEAQLRQRIKALFAAFPRLNTRSIKLSSKSDSLSKAITLFQISWFSLMFLLRLIKHLPITELEIGTMATILLSIATYGYWWGKPQDSHETAVLELDGEHLLSPSSEFKNAFFEGCGERVIRLQYGYIPFDTGTSSITYLDEKPDPEKLKCLSFESDFSPAIITPLPVPSPTGLTGSSTGAPDFWYPNQPSHNTLRYASYALLLELFGLVHLVGCFQSFPTRAEYVVWCVMTGLLIGLPVLVALVGGPLVLLFGAQRALGQGALGASGGEVESGAASEALVGGGKGSGSGEGRESGGENEKDWKALAVFLLATPWVLAFMVARLILLVLMFVCLRSQPEGAYKAVQWMGYVIHI